MKKKKKYKWCAKRGEKMESYKMESYKCSIKIKENKKEWRVMNRK